MIQRKQSLCLLIVSLVAFILLFADPGYATFENHTTKSATYLNYTTTVFQNGDVSNSVAKWINILIIGFIALGSLLAIFLFRKKELQKKLCIYLTLLEALLLIVMVMDYNTMKNQYPNSNTYPGIWSVFPLVMIVLSFMAWRGIRKDEAILKSMDRIR
jgi:peptidoglycan/LPS O-acetylase OafA/YrhL